MTHAYTVETHTLYLKLEGLFSLQSLNLPCVFQFVLLYNLLSTQKHDLYHCTRTVNKSVARKLIWIKEKHNTDIKWSGWWQILRKHRRGEKKKWQCGDDPNAHTVPQPLWACARTIPWFPPWTATEPAAPPHSAADPPAPYCEPITHSNVSKHTPFYSPLFYIILFIHPVFNPLPLSSPYPSSVLFLWY